MKLIIFKGKIPIVNQTTHTFVDIQKQMLEELMKVIDELQGAYSKPVLL